MGTKTTSGTRPIDLVIGRLESGGFDPRPAGGGGWESRCPVHQGSRHNLSIKEASDGIVLLHCHHAHENGQPSCTAQAIAGSLDIEFKHLFPSAVAGARPPRAKETPKRPRDHPPSTPRRAYPSPESAIAYYVRNYGRPTAHWVYPDPDGFELMRMYRFSFLDKAGEPDKVYRPVHPSADGWRVGDPPGDLPLFNLNKLTAAELAIVVEGEKCACLVDTLGLVGTTSAHGANSALKTDWSPLAGKKAVILPDHIDGQDYAQSVAQILTDLDPPAEVRILPLPGLKAKGDDIEQWLEGLPQDWTPADRRIELERLILTAPTWSAPPPEPPKLPVTIDENGFNLTEWGNAQRLIRAYGDRLRYCHSRSIWLTWDGRRWDPAERGTIWQWTKETIRQLVIEASETGDHDLSVQTYRWALYCQRQKVMAATINLAWSEPGVGVVAGDFDRDPWLLNCPNGTVDLRTGDLRPHNRENLLSKLTLCDYEPTAHCPRWRKALELIFAGDAEMISYIQRALGYSLTGDTGLQAIFLCHGKGRNGKNTVLDTVRAILHDYATVAAPRILLAAGQNDHPTALADLMGRRFVPTSEVDKGERMAESLVKRLTGDRTIKARFMRQDPFEFAVTFKLWMLANARPEIKGRDEGIWSRIKLIPFEVFIPPEKRIPNLSEILVAEEGPGILGWIVQGAVDWRRDGLQDPRKVTEAMESYRAEQDVLADFLADCCVSHLANECLFDKVRVRATELYVRYQDWCKESGEKDVLSKRLFGQELSDRGYTLIPSNGVHYRYGLELKDRDERGKVEDLDPGPA